MTSCARCGRSPIHLTGIATRIIGTRRLTGYYCHGEDDKDPTCYMLSMWADFPELQVP